MIVFDQSRPTESVATVAAVNNNEESFSLPLSASFGLTRQGLSEAVLVGHSMGGKAAAMTALLHPEVVRGLIVMDIAPVSYSM